MAYGAIKHTVKVCSNKLKFLCRCFHGTRSTVDLNEPEITDMVRKVQLLLQPTSTVINYGADDNEAT